MVSLGNIKEIDMSFFKKLLNSKKNKVNNDVPNTSNLLPSHQEILTKLKNASTLGSSGIGSGCDMATDLKPGYDQPLPLQTQLRESEILYYTDWQSQKIIDIPVDDMLRKPWNYEGLEKDQITRLNHYHSRLQLQRVLREALRLERLHGGSIIFIGIRDDIDDPSKPISELDLRPDNVLFLNAASRNRVSKITNQTNPTQPDYGRPLAYFVNGIEVHRSRLMIFDGDPLLPVNTGVAATSSFNLVNGFGVPILMRLYNSLLQATGSRQAAFHLINRASMMIFSGDIQSQAGTVKGVDSLSILQRTLQSMSNYKAAIFQKNAGDGGMAVSNLAATFGSVPELMMSYIQVLSAGSDIPATRFLGQAPGGLNATGEADLENYYNMINARQQHRLEPQLRKLFRLTMASADIDVDMEDITIDFPPLWNASETEEATIRQIDTTNIATLVNQGLISDEEAVEELKQRNILLTEPDNFPEPERMTEENDVDLQQKIRELREQTTKST